MLNRPFISEYFSALYALFSIAFAGACGAFFHQIHSPQKRFSMRVLEWFCGAICAVYGSELVAFISYHLLVKYDLIGAQQISPEKLYGFSGFLCGALGANCSKLFFSLIKPRLTQER